MATSGRALRLVLHADIHPQAGMTLITSGLALSVHELRNRGVHLREIGVEPCGLGDALIDALRNDLTLDVRVSPIPSR